MPGCFTVTKETMTMCRYCDAPGPAAGPAQDDPRAKVLDRLEARLLAIGGTRLVRKPPDPNPGAVLDRGKLFDLPVKLQARERSRCHENSAAVWGSDVRRYRLVTG